MKRRSFVGKGILAATGLGLIPEILKSKAFTQSYAYSEGEKHKPLVISTWNHGIPANEEAWKILKSGGSALDAAEKGVMVVEADPKIHSVGYGGKPDRDGHVTLDACIMDHNGNCGSVCFLEDIMHPVSVARLVMEQTPHVMLAGDGARQFALEHGFVKTNLLTPESEKDWQQWKEKSHYNPRANSENHDTIGMLVLDNEGKIAGACTTSGMAYKIHGRVGDSPVIGAGLYVDGKVGGAVATGHGEYVMKTLGSFLVVELMRQGMDPMTACKEAINRIQDMASGHGEVQVGLLAITNEGEFGAFSLKPGFNYALYADDENTLIDSKYLMSW